MAKAATRAKSTREEKKATLEEKQAIITKLVSEGTRPDVVDVPTYYASTIRLSADRNTVGMLFARNKPVEIKAGNETLHAAIQTPVAQIDMSIETAKDLAVLLAGSIEVIEREWGVIETPFTRKRAAEKEAEAKARTRRKAH